MQGYGIFMKVNRVLSLLILTLAVSSLTLHQLQSNVNIVHAESIGPYATIFPNNGTVKTNILIEIRNLTYDVHYDLYLYWDNIPLNESLPNPSYWQSGGTTLTWLPYYDIEMNAPNELPLSDFGNHTILIQIWTFDYTQLVFNSTLTFDIIEQLPDNEWLALNATYYQLLANYNALNTSYQNLLAQFNSLNIKYNAMNITYNQLKANYNELVGSYNGLNSSYNSLQSIQNTLTLNYARLQGNYTSLVSSFSDLQTKYNNLSTDLTNYKDLTYAIIITTVVFLATTIYFARRKSEKP